MLYRKRRSLLTSDFYVQRLVALQRTSQRSAFVAVWRGNEMMDDPVVVSDVPNPSNGNDKPCYRRNGPLEIESVLHPGDN